MDCAQTFWMIESKGIDATAKRIKKNERNNRKWKKNVYFSSHLYLFLPSTSSSFFVVIATTEPLLSSQSTNVHGIRTKIKIYIPNIFTMTKAKATSKIHNQFLFRLFVLCHQFSNNLSTKMSECISSSAPTKFYKLFTISVKKNWFINTHNKLSFRIGFSALIH